MDKRKTQNVLNFLLSDRFTFKGTDTLALLECVVELQREIANGDQANPQDGNTEGSTS